MIEEVSKDQALKTIVKGSGISFFGMIFSNITLYILRLILARALSPEDYGILFLGLSVINIVMFLSVLGIGEGIQKYVPHYRVKGDERRTKGVIISSLYIIIPISVIISISLFLFSEQISIILFKEPMLSPVLKIFSLILPFFAIYSIFSSLLKGFKKIGYPVIAWQVGKPGITLFLVIISLFFGYGLYGTAVAYLFGFAIASVIVFTYSETKVFPIISNKIKSIQIKRELLLFSIPLVVFNILGNFMTRIDTLMIGAMMKSTDVGLYQTAMPTAQFLFIIPSALTALILPVISELLSGGKKDDIRNIYKTIPKWIFYLNFPLFLITFMYPSAVLNILFGYEYTAASESLRILSIGFMIYSTGLISGTMLTAFGKTKYHMINAGISLIIGASLNYILIPIYGINGASIATAITFTIYVLMPIIETYAISKGLPFHKDIIKSLIAGITSMIIVHSLTTFLFQELNVFVLIPMLLIFVIFYLVIILLLNGISKDDIMILKSIEKKSGIRLDIVEKIVKKIIRT